MFTVALDTSVLWPSLQRDFLLSLAVEGVYRPVWSSGVLDELEFHEARKLFQRQRMSQGEALRRATRLVQQMRLAFSDSEIHGWETLAGKYELPDPDDEHVLAAAVLSGANVIVTRNLKDFPAALLPEPLEAIDAPEFASQAVRLAPAAALEALRAMSDRSGRHGPRQAGEHILDLLDHRYGMTEAVQLLRESPEARTGADASPRS